MAIKKAIKSLKRKPKTLKAIETKVVIKKATIHILLKEGIGSLNTNRIAEVAGLSVGTLYQYYSDKEEITSEILQSILDARINGVKNALTIGMVFDSIDKIVSTTVDGLMDSLTEESAALEIILLPHALNNKRSLLFQKIKEANDLFIPLLKLLLTAKARGLKKRNLETVSYILVHSTRAIITGRFLNQELRITDKELKDELKLLILGFINAEEKVKLT
jgi:AcrR family transcriptional regulator